MVPESPSAGRRSLGLLLRTAYDALAREVYGRLAETGFPDVRPAHSAVFRYLPPEGAHLVDLAAAAGMRKQSMGYLVDDLESLAYVESAPDPGDRRARTVRFTTRGQEAWETLIRLSHETEAAWSAPLGPRDWAVTRRTLERLATQIEAGKQLA